MYITSGACDTVYDFFICYELVIEVLFCFCLSSLSRTHTEWCHLLYMFRYVSSIPCIIIQLKTPLIIVNLEPIFCVTGILIVLFVYFKILYCTDSKEIDKVKFGNFFFKHHCLIFYTTSVPC